MPLLHRSQHTSDAATSCLPKDQGSLGAPFHSQIPTPVYIGAQLKANKNGDTVFTIAAEKEHAELMTKLLDCGANVDCRNGAGSSALLVYGALFRQKFTLEDAIGSHACSLEANMRVTNCIPLERSLSNQLTR
jgi:hypothetical protein